MPQRGKIIGSGLCFIAGSAFSRMTIEDMTLAALKAGAAWIQYREKNEARRVIYKQALKLRQMTAEFGALFVVNDHPDIAAAADADGVHLGQDDLPVKEARKVVGEKIIGKSTHSPAEALEAEDDGADYIGFGPVFRSPTKDAGEPKGVSALKEIKGEINIPVVAIGGITLENIGSVLDAGADAVAVASAILTGEISHNVRAFLEIIKRHGYNNNLVRY